MIELLDDDAVVRRRATRALDLGRDGALFALRHVLLLDPDATVRGHAAFRLGLRRDARAWRWLLEAADDVAPSVRDAALRALARLASAAQGPDDAPELRRHVVEETVWWVRRSAVLTTAVVCGGAALDILLVALGDPFWRVRHAAVQALAALGDAEHALRLRVLEACATTGGGDARARAAAVRYLSARWGGTPHDAAELRRLVGEVAQDEGPRRVAPLDDDDPAVVAARLDALDDVDPRALVALLDESHEPTRARAVRRLVGLQDASALEASLSWLTDPRRTHAPVATRVVLDASPRALVRRIAARVLAGSTAVGGAGALEWALDWLVRRAELELLPLARAHARHGDRHVRAATARALALAVRPAGGSELRARPAGPDSTVRPAGGSELRARPAGPESTDEHVELLRAALLDADADVRAVAIRALVDDPATHELPVRAQRPAARRLLVARAMLEGRFEQVREALSDPDPTVRAIAVSSLDERAVREAARRDVDPWIRVAALEAGSALDALASDPDPWVVRAAANLLARRARTLSAALRLQAGAEGARSPDAWVRARAADVLDPSDAAALALLVPLSRDRSLMVRAAAAERLEDVPASRLREVLATTDTPDVALGAIARLWQAGEHDVSQVPAAWRATPAVVALLDALRVADADDATPAERAQLEPSSRRAWVPLEVAHVEHRALGGAGLSVAPLALSGAFDLSPAVYAEAYAAGADLFFWEPHHGNLTRFLRRRGRAAKVVAGTFHADAPSIERDVDTAMRRLRRGRLDVFLLFWVRSAARVDAQAFDVMRRLQASGKVGAIGFSTHLRELACDALAAQPWDVVMIRHSAAHPGAEARLLSVARARGAGVLTFSALCYGRMLQPTGKGPAPSAADCYRYSLAQPGVTAVISAPRRRRELRQNLEVLARPTLDPAAVDALRSQGERVRSGNVRWNALVRGGGAARELVLQLLDEAQDEGVMPLEDPAGARRRLLRACVSSRGRGRASDPSAALRRGRP